MTSAKRLMMIEVACDLVHQVHHDLCLSREIKEAEQTMEIQRQLILLSDALEKASRNKERTPKAKSEPASKVTPETIAALNAIGRKIHPNE